MTVKTPQEIALELAPDYDISDAVYYDSHETDTPVTMWLSSIQELIAAAIEADRAQFAPTDDNSTKTAKSLVRERFPYAEGNEFWQLLQLVLAGQRSAWVEANATRKDDA